MRERQKAKEDMREVVLVDRLATAEFMYFGTSGQETQPRWREIWQGNPKLPLLVRVRITFPPGDPRRWPEMIIAPAITTITGEG
jgi:general secretion pathway protein J